MDAKTDNQHLPQVDKVLRHPPLVAAQSSVQRGILTCLVRKELAFWRAEIACGKTHIPTIDEVSENVLTSLHKLQKRSLRKVINGTGVILSTNLGRAPLAEKAAERLKEIATGYSSLEFDLSTGKRGERTAYIEEVLCLLLGCEQAIVVNNNAAAVLLCVQTFAQGKDVVVSRGELVEIGGSFRLPDVIVSAGGLLREVGTTNKTRTDDFRKAISERTGAILKCHRSNFEMRGFTEEASLNELVTLANEANIPLIEDLGSGAMIPLPNGLEEPTVASVIESGCDLVTFSADKLLGGPQAGMICGKAKFVEKLRKNPLYRALRLDKLVICALEASLEAYLNPHPDEVVPVLNMLSRSESEIEGQVLRFIDRLGGKLESLRLEGVRTKSTAGGGTLPERVLDSHGIAILSSHSPDRLMTLLRSAPTPIIALIKEDNVIIDFRSISASDEILVEQGLLYLDKA